MRSPPPPPSVCLSGCTAEASIVNQYAKEESLGLKAKRDFIDTSRKDPLLLLFFFYFPLADRLSNSTIAHGTYVSRSGHTLQSIVCRRPVRGATAAIDDDPGD